MSRRGLQALQFLPLGRLRCPARKGRPAAQVGGETCRPRDVFLAMFCIRLCEAVEGSGDRGRGE